METGGPSQEETWNWEHWFAVFHGDQAENWLILKNGDVVIGLFQGMFDENIMTFNPGWNQEAEALPKFKDVREL